MTTACNDDGPTSPGALARIMVTPGTPSLMVGATQQFTAVGEDAKGATVTITPTWSVVAGGGTISSSGLFTAGNTPGVFTATVRATSGSINGTMSVTVTIGAATTLTLTPTPATIAAGGTQQFTLVATDAGGNVVTVTPTWSVAAGGGTISPTGLFTAGATPGTYTNTVVANSGSLTVASTVTVTTGALTTVTVTPTPATLAGGATQQFTAVGRDGSGNLLAITPVWSVVNGGGTISATGLFTANGAAGTYTNTVRANSGTINGSATVVVTANALASITVVPSPAAMAVNATQQYTVIGRDAGGNVVAVTPTWSVVNGGGTINGSGLFTAGAVVGTYFNTVRAASGAIAGTATVTVTAGAAPASSVPLGAAAANGVLAGQAVTCIGGTTVNGDLSVSPGTGLNGFGPCVLTGAQHLNDAAAIASQAALTTAYNTAAGFACPPANLVAGNLGGTTKGAGVYCATGSLSITGVFTLDGAGDPNATFVFQVGTSLAGAGSIVLVNGAQAKNVFWQVGGATSFANGSQWQGTIMSLTGITFGDNVTLVGRALSRNGTVALGNGNLIILP
jgi:hypothetical protein